MVTQFGWAPTIKEKKYIIYPRITHHEEKIKKKDNKK